MTTDANVADASVHPRRLFFALWPAPVLAEELTRDGAQWLAQAHARPIRPENIHLTLAFLGVVHGERVECFRQAATQVTTPAFTLVLDHAECFRRAGILWVGPSALPALLLALVQQLNAALRACGYQPERRDYRAHISLARQVRRCPRLPVPVPRAWEVREFVLVESHLEPGGARYEILERWPLTAQ
jgi:2'-5' RNA ligase